MNVKLLYSYTLCCHDMLHTCDWDAVQLDVLHRATGPERSSHSVSFFVTKQSQFFREEFFTHTHVTTNSHITIKTKLSKFHTHT